METIRIKVESIDLKKYLKYFLIVIAVYLLESLIHLLIPLDINKLQPITQNKQAPVSDTWLPVIGTTNTSTSIPKELTAKSYLTYDLTTGKALYQKNPNMRMPMASLTKIMTAIVTIEHPRADDRYVVKKESLVGYDSMGLSAGEVLSKKELLYGLLLPSGNDASEVLASDSPLGRERFIQAMNDKAKELGLKDTHFDNPSGLQGEGIQYTTAYDLLVITHYALGNYPLIASIVNSHTFEVPQTTTHKAYALSNETNLLRTYDGVQGVKTGYTPEAGLCLVTYLDYKGHKIIGVLLNSQDRRGEMKTLLDSSLKAVQVNPPIYRG